jgi:TRAP-type mannitol/chloroaromatic compound transport system permease small subunit
MDGWLRIAAGIDALTRAVARIAQWALLANALLVAGNAIIRKLFNVSVLVIFDLQWHFFAAVVLLMAAYTLQRNEHVRVDILAPRLGERGLAWLDLFGMVLILLPLCLFMTWVGMQATIEALLIGERYWVFSDLPAWSMKSLVPVGFLLLALQGVAEAIRCVACLKGVVARPVHRHQLIDGEPVGH